MNRRLVPICISSGVVVLGLLFLAASPILAGEQLNRIVAVVNQDVITLHELNEKIREMSGQDPEMLKAQNERNYLDAREKVIEMLIDEKLTEAKVKELKIKVTQKQVEDTIERIKRENKITQEELLDSLRKDGIPYEKFQERIRKDLERMNLINSEVRSKILITDERVKNYYEENKARFAGEVRVSLAGILLVRKSEGGAQGDEELLGKGREVLQALRNGEDFEALAKKYSDGPGAESGGDLGTFRVSQLEPELQRVVNSLPVGGISNAIIRPNGIQIIKVLSREGGGEKSFDEAKESIYSTLYQEEVNRRYATWIKELRERSYTRIIF